LDLFRPYRKNEINPLFIETAENNINKVLKTASNRQIALSKALISLQRNKDVDPSIFLSVALQEINFGHLDIVSSEEFLLEEENQQIKKNNFQICSNVGNEKKLISTDSLNEIRHYAASLPKTPNIYPALSKYFDSTIFKKK
jgi:hypothetical protein